MHEALIPSGAFLGVDLILVSTVTEKPSRGGATSKAASDRWLASWGMAEPRPHVFQPLYYNFLCTLPRTC